MNWSMRLVLALGCSLAAVGAVAQDFDSLVPGASAKAPLPPVAQPSAPAPPAPRPHAAPTSDAPHAPSAIVPVRTPPGAAAPVVINATLSRTAVWVGEPLTYTVEAICPAGTDILATDLGRDRLRLSGLDITEATEGKSVEANGTTVYRSQFRLVSFVTDGSHVGFEAQPVRYYVHTAGQAADTLVPADEIALPAAAIAVRSSLPDAGVTWIRDARSTVFLPRTFALLMPVGLAAIALSIVPAAIVLIGLGRSRLPRRIRRPARSLTRYRQSIEEIRATGSSVDVKARRAAFTRVAALLRERLGELGVSAEALTSGELEKALGGHRVPASAGLLEVLRTCERATYGRIEDVPSNDALAAALRETEHLLAVRG